MAPDDLNSALLPPEIWIEIASLLPPPQLCRLCRTCHHLRDIVRPILYREVCLTEFHAKQVLSLLVSNEDFAPLVHTLRLDLIAKGESIPVAAALRKMINLGDLQITGEVLMNRHEQKDFVTSLQRRDKPLRSFSFEEANAEKALHGTGFAIPHLTSISWSSDDTYLNLRHSNSTITQLLETLEASKDTLSTISLNPIVKTSFPMFKKRFPKLRSLSFGTFSLNRSDRVFPRPLLRFIAAHDLEELHFLNSDSDLDIPDTPFQPVPVPSTLSNLRKFTGSLDIFNYLTEQYTTSFRSSLQVMKLGISGAYKWNHSALPHLKEIEATLPCPADKDDLTHILSFLTRTCAGSLEILRVHPKRWKERIQLGEMIDHFTPLTSLRSIDLSGLRSPGARGDALVFAQKLPRLEVIRVFLTASFIVKRTSQSISIRTVVDDKPS